MTGELTRRGKSGHTNTNPDPEGRKPCDAGDRDWSDASRGHQGFLEMTRSWEEARKELPWSL